MEHLDLDGNHITNATLERIHALLEEVKKPAMLAEMDNNDDDEEFDDGFDLSEFALSLVCLETNRCAHPIGRTRIGRENFSFSFLFLSQS